MKRAVVLLSGGLDSATALAIACSEGYACLALTINYGQRHAAEIRAAKDIAEMFQASHVIRNFEMFGSLASSALTSRAIPVPLDRSDAEIAGGIPVTYVPARNTVLLSLAFAAAESQEADAVFVGFNVLDASGYPDCRREFVEAMQRVADVGLARRIQIRAPLIDLSKAEIIAWGQRLGIDYSRTHSCYAPVASDRACRRCDACRLRARGFAEAGVSDPTRYV